jgi:hypothetical protein
MQLNTVLMGSWGERRVKQAHVKPLILPQSYQVFLGIL